MVPKAAKAIIPTIAPVCQTEYHPSGEKKKTRNPIADINRAMSPTKSLVIRFLSYLLLPKAVSFRNPRSLLVG